jgi:hypothetical protein
MSRALNEKEGELSEKLKILEKLSLEMEDLTLRFNGL